MIKGNKVFSIIFALSIFVGIVLTLLWKNPMQNVNENSMSRQTISLMNNEEQLLKKQERKLSSLNKTYSKLQKQYNFEEEMLSKDELKNYKDLKVFLGVENLIGEGIIIKIETIDDNHNPAFEFDYNRTLLKIFNFAKQKGAEVLAINNHIIFNNTGVVLAGNHINVNDIPITPPYELKIYGNEKKLYRYFNDESVFMMVLRQNLDLKISIDKSRKITLPKIGVYTQLEYLQEKKWYKFAM